MQVHCGSQDTCDSTDGCSVDVARRPVVDRLVDLGAVEVGNLELQGLRGVLAHGRVADDASADRVVGLVGDDNIQGSRNSSTVRSVRSTDGRLSIGCNVSGSNELAGSCADGADSRVADSPVRYVDDGSGVVGERNTQLIRGGATFTNRGTAYDGCRTRIHSGITNCHRLRGVDGTTFQSVRGTDGGLLILGSVGSRNEHTVTVDGTSLLVARFPVRLSEVTLGVIGEGNTQDVVRTGIFIDSLRADDGRAQRIHGQVTNQNGHGSRHSVAVEGIRGTDGGCLIGGQLTNNNTSGVGIEHTGARVGRGEGVRGHTRGSTVIKLSDDRVNGFGVFGDFVQTYNRQTGDIDLDSGVNDSHVHSLGHVDAALRLSPASFNAHHFVLINVQGNEVTAAAADSSDRAVTYDGPLGGHIVDARTVTQQGVCTEGERHLLVDFTALRADDFQAFQHRTIVHEVSSSRTTPHTNPLAFLRAGTSNHEDVARQRVVDRVDLDVVGVDASSALDHGDRQLGVSVVSRDTRIRHTRVVGFNNHRAVRIRRVVAVQSEQAAHVYSSCGKLRNIHFTQQHTIADIPVLLFSKHFVGSVDTHPSVAVVQACIRAGATQHGAEIRTLRISNDPAHVERQSDVVRFEERDDNDHGLAVRHSVLHGNGVFPCEVPEVSKSHRLIDIGGKPLHEETPISFECPRWSVGARLQWSQSSLRAPHLEPELHYRRQSRRQWQS